ncbi:MAG: tetratricopeptide repeat protein [Acidobacteria bacterium]|nr:tetratricopeptide repeat protein [Acidobacteriota bacterium]
MRTCPQCNSVFPEDYLFCLNDGTMLAENDAEQETVVQARFAQPTSALSPDMIAECVSCGLANRGNSKFCKKCGTALGVSASSQEPLPPFSFPKMEIHPLSSGGQPIAAKDFASQSHPPPSGETVAVASPTFVPPIFNGPGGSQSGAGSRKSQTNLLAVIGVMLAAVLGGGAYWYLTLPHPAESKLDKAITGNKILEPAGENAYEFYKQLKQQGADPKVLAKFEDRLYPILTDRPKELLKTVLEPGITEKRVEEWQDAVKMLEWAVDMRPSENQVAAKAAYCKGRVHYLLEQKDQAIEQWKKSADLDKKWALPLNGIGLIFNERRDYDTARTWLRQAVERDPKWPIPYNNIGTSYYYQKSYPDALAHYRKAVELAPKWARPHAWLGSIALENYEYQTAVSEFEQVLAPDAVGAAEMNLEKIRKQLEEARNMASYESE